MAYEIYGNFGKLLATVETESEAEEQASIYTTPVLIIEA